MRAIGVREIAAYLTGAIGRAETIARGSQATRNYAKRQYLFAHHRPPTGRASPRRSTSPPRWNCLARAPSQRRWTSCATPTSTPLRWPKARRGHGSQSGRAQSLNLKDSGVDARSPAQRLAESGRRRRAVPQGQRHRRSGGLGGRRDDAAPMKSSAAVPANRAAFARGRRAGLQQRCDPFQLHRAGATRRLPGRAEGSRHRAAHLYQDGRG